MPPLVLEKDPVNTRSDSRREGFPFHARPTTAVVVGEDGPSAHKVSDSRRREMTYRLTMNIVYVSFT